MIISILGRETNLALAEIESAVGADKLHTFGSQAALIDSSIAPILSGSPKVGELIEEIVAAPWQLQSQHLAMAIQDYIDALPVGKVTIGLSVYGVELKPKQIHEFLLEVKNNMKTKGRSVRVVPNNKTVLNSASVIHNKLTGRRNAEFLYVQFGNRSILGRTTRVQDIDAFAKRDREKPSRDAKVGMLPPKLAKLMLTLAKNDEGYQSGWILDPFCGTGTVLLEASAMGCASYGTDLSEKMIKATERNVEWFVDSGLALGEMVCEVGDARKHKWQLKKPLSAVVAEGYLGPPMSKSPTKPILSKVQAEVEKLMTAFLKNLHGQLKSGSPVVLAVPAWHTKKDVARLTVVDEIEKLGYTRRDFEHVHGPLIYRREGQIVGREILVLNRS